MSDQPSRFPVRHVDGHGWEVLIAGRDNWLSCRNEEDARTISSAPTLEVDVLEGRRRGDEFAAELERLADMLERYRMGFGSRFFSSSARDARR
jgi:hypothetical protein